MVMTLAKEMEQEALNNLDPEVLESINQETKQVVDNFIDNQVNYSGGVINCLPTIKDENHPRCGWLEPQFAQYYRFCGGQNIFFDQNDPFNDFVIIIHGPRGGGKTISAVGISILDGMMRGIPVISNIPFSFVARDAFGKLYKVEAIPFDVEKFAAGDISMKYKRLLLDEGNYLADRLRSTSTKNIAITDILQQARKFRMSIVFCTINYMWIDPRITGNLCDVTMECKDFYYDHYYKKKYNLRKGQYVSWNAIDVSGKITGNENMPLDSGPFDARPFWKTYDTENFVDPREARRRLNKPEKTIMDENGQEITMGQWYHSLESKLASIPDGEYNNREWWDRLGIEDATLKLMAGRHLSKLGIQRAGHNLSNYVKEMVPA